MTYATDSRPGDLIRTIGRGDARRLADRTYPEVGFTFEARWANGATQRIRKDRMIQIRDPDGSVAARVRELSVEAIR